MTRWYWQDDVRPPQPQPSIFETMTAAPRPPKDPPMTHPAEFPHDPFAASTWWTGEAVDQLVRGLKLNPRMLSFRIAREWVEDDIAGGQVVIGAVDHVRATGDPRVYVVASIADVTAPTAAELAAGRDITAAVSLTDIWGDSPGVRAASDRMAGTRIPFDSDDGEAIEP